MPLSSLPSRSAALPLWPRSPPSVTWSPAVAGPESAFRNKAKLVVAGRAGAVTLGILDDAGRGVDLRECGLYEPGLARTFPVLADFVDALRLEPYDVPARRGELKYLIVTHSPDDELMIRFVLRTGHEVPRIRKALPRLVAALPRIAVVSVNLQPEHKAILEGDTEILLTERSTLPMRVNDVVLGLRPNSFFQTNTAVAAALYRQAREWVEGRSPASVWDLYCGVGGFALHVAGPDRAVARDRGGFQRGRERPRQCERPAAAAPGHAGRSGSRRPMPRPTLAPISQAQPAQTSSSSTRLGAASDQTWPVGSRRPAVRDVIYSSCNVDSLARDLAAMPSFCAHEARLFDMFPQTNHHEVMVRLHRAAGLEAADVPASPSRSESPAATTEARCVPVQGVEHLR